MCRGDRKKMCIPRYKFCDGVPDCKHGTDEDPKYCGQFSPHDAVLARYMSWSWGYVRLVACLLQGGVVKMAICTSPGDGRRSKFCWPPVSDVAAVTKPRRQTR